MKYKLNLDKIIVRKFEDAVIILDVKDDEYYTFTDVGNFIISNMIDGKELTILEIIDSVKESYEVTATQELGLSNDISSFIEELINMQFIERK